MPLTTQPPFLLGNIAPPRLISAAERYWRDRALVFGLVMEGQAPWSPKDLVRGLAPTTAATGKKAGFSELGYGMLLDASDNGLVFPLPSGVPGTITNITTMSIVRPNTVNAGTLQKILTLGNDENDPDVGISYDTTNSRFVYVENAVDQATASTSPAGPVYVLVSTKSGTAKKLFVNGINRISTTAGSASRTSPGSQLLFGGTGVWASGVYVACAVWNRTLTDTECIHMSRALMRAMQSPIVYRSRFDTAGGGISGSVTESGSATDSQSATATFASARAEALTAADTPAATMITAVAASESLSAADAQIGTIVTAAASTDALSASDAETGTVTTAAIRAETLTATDSQDATVTAAGNASTVDTLTAVESVTATVVFAAAVIDALTAADSETGPVTATAVRVESLTVSDAQTATLIAQGITLESLAAADQLLATAVMNVAITELLAAIDASTTGDPSVPEYPSGRFTLDDIQPRFVINDPQATFTLRQDYPA